MAFALHQRESATSAHVSPNPETPSHIHPDPTPLIFHRALAFCALFLALNLHLSSILHMVYTCFNAVLSNHATIAFSHRVPKSVLYICVSFAALHIALSLLPF